MSILDSFTARIPFKDHQHQEESGKLRQCIWHDGSLGKENH